MTYNEAYNKIIDAYFKDEIKPMQSRFCFCGTLSPNKHWRNQYGGFCPYTMVEYEKMETALFRGMAEKYVFSVEGLNNYTWLTSENYEERLFDGMSKALGVLKSIHEKRGEIFDEQIQFKKRELLQT